MGVGVAGEERHDRQCAQKPGVHQTSMHCSSGPHSIEMGLETKTKLDPSASASISWPVVPAYYRARLQKFVADSPSSIIGELTVANAKASFPLSPEAIEAWRVQLPPLQSACQYVLSVLPQSDDWEILLEYPIPRVGRRIDAVILARGLIIIIETKTGAAPTSAAQQVEDYAINLACFHEASRNKKIVPIVVSNAPTRASKIPLPFRSSIESCHFSPFNQLGKELEAVWRECADNLQSIIDCTQWNQARFKPIPPIIDAAVSLYKGMNVFEIGHACAAQEDLDRTTQSLVGEVLRARVNSQKLICFVTGVPGAGKTLVGLNTVHQPEIRNFASFLSGNGPLVKVIQEALVRDVLRKREPGRNRRVAEVEVRTFIHNVHRFADEYYTEGSPTPVQHVVVFDEAQRAWDLTQNVRAKRPAVSEPHMMLQVMDRHQDWSVIIALVGGGQEINRGEAGLAEWGRALAHFPKWQVRASPEVIQGGSSVAGFRLFQDPDPFPNRVGAIETLHLAVCTRSIRAQRISDWVNLLLEGDSIQAARVAAQLGEKPVITRNLNTARTWIRSQQRGTTRSGLVASASAARLRSDGLEISFDFHQSFEWEHWFLDDLLCTTNGSSHKYCGDIRCSSRLEVAATQFEIQGLELDWVGVCWGEDLVWSGERWRTLRFNNKVWRENANAVKHSYMVNAYRVLLTRARQGMVIYVPNPTSHDTSRMPEDLNRTAEFLISCGAVTLDNPSPS